MLFVTNIGIFEIAFKIKVKKKKERKRTEVLLFSLLLMNDVFIIQNYTTKLKFELLLYFLRKKSSSFLYKQHFFKVTGKIKNNLIFPDIAVIIFGSK